MSNNARTEPRYDRPTRLGILISDGCEHCMAIASAVSSGLLRGCEVAVIISNVTGAPGIETARAAGLPVVVMEGRGRDQRDHESAISTLLRTYRVDLVCLAGYLRILSPGFVREWRGRVLAMHPSLLPAFPGLFAVEKALSYGVRFTGCTVFLADEPEPGTILVQRVVEVESGDTAESLSEKIATEEALAYPEAIRLMLSGDYKVLSHPLLPRPSAEELEGEPRRVGTPEHTGGQAAHERPTRPARPSTFSEPAVLA